MLGSTLEIKSDDMVCPDYRTSSYAVVVFKVFMGGLFANVLKAMVTMLMLKELGLKCLDFGQLVFVSDVQTIGLLLLQICFVWRKGELATVRELKFT